jgi:pimeloyl-ACP methyl ester carboxylesterase
MRSSSVDLAFVIPLITPVVVADLLGARRPSFRSTEWIVPNPRKVGHRGAMAKFVLVHGGMHGGWCWSLLRAELEGLGHQTTAVDYPCDDPEAGSGEYAAVIAEQIADTGADPIIVGHSMGGLAIPLLPALLPVGALVFLCAILPRPPVSYSDQVGAVEGVMREASIRLPDPNGRIVYTKEAMRTLFYSGVEESVADACISRLRPQAQKPLVEETPLSEWPDVPMFSIYGTDDRVVSAVYSASSAKRLGIPAVEMTGGHSPFLTRPRELSLNLDSMSRSTA